MIRTTLCLLIALLILPSYLSAQASDSGGQHETLYFIGFAEADWKVFTRKVDSDHYRTVTTDTEPRSVCLSAERQQLVYIGADDTLRQRSLSTGKEEVTYKPKDKESISQLFCTADLSRFFVMYMPDGKSSNADIAEIKAGKVSVVVKQLSSQFEPFLSGDKWLYYGNVHCLIDCEQIIREIWRKNIVSGEARQITLAGAITRNHVIDPKNKWVYFSSNHAERYKIWRQSLEDRRLEQLSRGEGNNDSFPAVDAQHTVYFIRQSPAEPVKLMRRDAVSLKAITLPEHVTDIRNLRINY